MRRREQVGPLPDRLRVFRPWRWLLPGEDPGDPIAVHAQAYRRWQCAVADASGLRDLVDVPDSDRWWGPIPGRTGCTCSVCSRGP